MSIARGAGEEEKASKLENVSFVLLILTGVVLMGVFYIFMKPILYLLGASDATYPVAASYLQIYLLGTLFIMISSGMNLFINAQGFGTMGMMTVCIGAVLNLFLDPLFIFVWKLGVRGAAIATVLSQMAGCMWVLWFLTGKKVQYPLQRKYMKLKDRKMILSILGLGLSGFIMCVTNSLSQIACNATLARWGGDLYVGAMTILNSVREIFNLAANGVAEGAKPVLGYNFGAKEYERVRKGIFVTCGMIMSYMVLAWLTVHFFPSFLVGFFTSDKALAEIAAPALKLFFAGFFYDGIYVLRTGDIRGAGIPEAGNFFQSVEKSCDRCAIDDITPIFYGS